MATIKEELTGTKYGAPGVHCCHQDFVGHVKRFSEPKGKTSDSRVRLHAILSEIRFC